MPVATLDSQLNTVLFNGTGTSTLVPGPFDFAVNGHAYVADLSFKPYKRQAFRFQSIDQIRAQADTSNVPSESSLNPNGLWRRTMESWHHGAGQVHFDRKTSDPYQFRVSKGVNVWTQWQATLLPDTTQSLASTNTNVAFAVAGSFLYAIDGQALRRTSDGVNWTTITGTPAATASSIASDGATVYVAYGASGIYSSPNSGTTATQYVTSAIDANAVLGFVMGRLMLGSTNKLYNIIAGGALPTVLFTSNYASFLFVGFAEGQTVLYAAGYSGDKSVVYRVGITSDGTTLSAPVLSVVLPTGEVIRAIFGYVGGQVAIGTDLGWRFGNTGNTSGDITLGALVMTPNPVKAFTAYQRFIYFAYTNYDTTSTGVGRMDPTFESNPLVPAYASDLMVTGQGIVTGIAQLAGNIYIAVAGLGVYAQAATMVASGTIDSGLITYDIVDLKVPVFVDIGMTANAATVSSWLSLDGGAFTLLGTTMAQNTFTEFPTSQTASHTMEVRAILNLVSATSPVLTRQTIRSVPASATPLDCLAVARFDHQVEIRQAGGGGEAYQDPFDEFDFLDNLRLSKQVVTYQYGRKSRAVTVESLDLIPEGISRDHTQWDCVLVIGLRTIV